MPPDGANEVDAWQRRVRQQEATGRAAMDDAHRLVTSQRAQVDKLKQENGRMQEELAVDKSPARQPSATQQDRIDKLHELADSFQRKIEVERRQVELIDKELEVHQAKALEARKVVSGPAAAGEVVKQAARSLKVLENRLEQADTRFSQGISKNKELRELIDSMAKQQASVEGVLYKLEKELGSKRGEVAATQDGANTSLDLRTAALEEVAALAAQNDREEAAYDDELRELAGCLDADQKLLQVQTRRFTRVLGATSSSGPATDDGSTASEVVARLQHECDIEELHALLAHCKSLEAGNFAIFTACNAASDEVSRLQSAARTCQAELRNLELEGVLGRQKDVIRQTLSKRDQASRRLDTLRDKHGGVQRRLALVQAGITTVLKALGGPPPTAPPSAVPGTSTSERAAASAAVLLLQLASLEARARAIVAVHSTMMGKPNTMVAAAIAGRPSAPLPSTQRKSAGVKGAKGGAGGGGDTSGGSSDDEEEMPLTREQIQARMKK